jgi:hypothetical protein
VGQSGFARFGLKARRGRSPGLEGSPRPGGFAGPRSPGASHAAVREPMKARLSLPGSAALFARSHRRLFDLMRCRGRLRAAQGTTPRPRNAVGVMLAVAA